MAYVNTYLYYYAAIIMMIILEGNLRGGLKRTRISRFYYGLLDSCPDKSLGDICNTSHSLKMTSNETPTFPSSIALIWLKNRLQVEEPFLRQTMSKRTVPVAY